ncbi:SIS domain-containing protein [Clostridium neuense]|uniref:SIS domain-containing protein n=1 Tax=Clostridium neuense TaxID=1728934 RepID=A0ABW8TAC7_9CLOT
MKMTDYVKLSSERLKHNFLHSNDLCKDICNEYIKSGKSGIRIIASGSSYNSSMAARIYMQDKLNELVQVVTPEVFINFKNQPADNMFNIVVSQSGCSTNIIEALKFMQKNGTKRVVLTGNLDSDVKDYADVLIDYGVGIETVDYVTMGVVTLIEFLMLFALQAVVLKGRITKEKREIYLKQFENVIKSHSKMVELVEGFVKENKMKLSQLLPSFVCGNGPNYGVALEGSLKFQETLKVPTMAYETEEFIHGPNMQLTPNYSVYLIDDPVPNNRIYCIYMATKKITDKVYFITTRDDVNDDGCIIIPKIEDANMMPILSVVVFQYIAAKMTDELDAWKTHPYFNEFEKLVSCKTDDYLDVMNGLKDKLNDR